ncbi:MAG: hypothetical protein A4E65_03623 [Syntrophorhabdus sp. PtaU1.Bin153]|nr:MAG: hypothetical protein A4E65_03623 [Syntrophorhabdus sp. PtaU1.Bin153]
MFINYHERINIGNQFPNNGDTQDHTSTLLQFIECISRMALRNEICAGLPRTYEPRTKVSPTRGKTTV